MRNADNIEAAFNPVMRMLGVAPEGLNNPMYKEKNSFSSSGSGNSRNSSGVGININNMSLSSDANSSAA